MAFKARVAKEVLRGSKGGRPDCLDGRATLGRSIQFHWVHPLVDGESRRVRRTTRKIRRRRRHLLDALLSKALAPSEEKVPLYIFMIAQELTVKRPGPPKMLTGSTIIGLSAT